MSEAPSVAEIVRAWVSAHPNVDMLLAAAFGALLIMLLLMGCAGILYWLWYAVRLCTPRHVKSFCSRPIPGIRKGKIAGGEFELGTALESFPAFDSGMIDAVQALDARALALEKSLQHVEIQIGRFEDVSGRLPPQREGH